MRFGPVAVEDSVGGILAHSVRRDGFVLKKGDIVQADHVSGLRGSGVETVVVARLDAGDVQENEAAARLAARLVGGHLRVDPPFTGRANLFATCAGVLMIDASRIAAVNTEDERITVATLPLMRAVVVGEMVATVKIIPFAVPEDALARAIAVAGEAAIAVAPFLPLRIGVVSTRLPGLKQGVIDKTLRVMAERVQPAGAPIVAQVTVPHATAPLAEAIEALAQAADIIVVFGASAITDRRDVIPQAIEAAGGRVDHFGMPVDPGNLLLLGTSRDGKQRVIGAPGCARSPKENGFDFVLQRLLAGLQVTGADLCAMGVGGLMMEIVSRPQPRLGGSAAPDDDG